MKLRHLDGKFLKYISDTEFLIVDSLNGADGVEFQCPKCSEGKDRGRETKHGETVRDYVIGAHYVICWFVGHVPDSTHPQPGRWNPQGSSLDDLTFIPPGSTSVLLTGPGCGWHGYVKNGEATLS